MNRTSIITAVAVLAFVGVACDPIEEAVISGIVEDVTAEPAPETTVPEDTRIPGGWLLYGADATGDCNGLYSSVGIPCRDILNVCVPSDTGEPTTKWMPHVFRCTDESPYAIDVCLTVPDTQWDFYGYTREECAALVG